MYSVKEAFYSLQGEGARSGRPAVFCRFSKCNLWNGREADRATAQCTFCDTHILGTDGQNGGRFSDAGSLSEHLNTLWPSESPHAQPYVVFTGGEPLLQLDESLIEAMHLLGFEVACETNGTLPAPDGIDWVCMSPKTLDNIALKDCDELKLVFPQLNVQPADFEHFDAQHFYLSPMANPLISSGPDETKAHNTDAALAYCLEHPQWRLSLQQHKILNID